MRKTRSLLIALCLLFAFAFVPAGALAQPSEPGFEIHFLDVGQADAAIAICDGRVLMIDGGNAADSSLVYSYLKNTLGVSHIDYMVCTHPHEDHVGGLSGALNACTVGEIFSPVATYDSAAYCAFLKYLALQMKTVQVPQAGDTYPLGTAAFQFLTPLRQGDPIENNLSLVVRITYGNTSFLFMGDAELRVEADLNAAQHEGMFELHADLIKVGHHGGETSTSFLLLQRAQPEYAVISVGEDNDYGHPSQYLLDRLNAAKVKTYRTDRDGHIICTSDGTSLSFVPEKTAHEE